MCEPHAGSESGFRRGGIRARGGIRIANPGSARGFEGKGGEVKQSSRALHLAELMLKSGAGARIVNPEAAFEVGTQRRNPDF